jgi:hypothetical protein
MLTDFYNLYEFFADEITDSLQSLFRNFGRKKRQIPDSECTSGDCSAPTFEELNFTDAQRQMCNNMSVCLYDLAITGDSEVADISRETNENTTILQNVVSK